MKRFLTAAALAALAAPAAAQTACSDMAGAAPAGVTITEATMVAQGDDSPAEHCRIRASMDERTGADGKPYALKFELTLPTDWQGRFLHQFNGGNDGAVKPATGAGTGVDGAALARGFAVVSSDAGHDGSANPEAGLAGSNMFGFDFEARKDYGYDAVATLHPVALALTEAHYGAAPTYVYGYGTSNGGRHAMIAAERMADAFDGLLAGYPGYNLPKAAIQHAWDVQSFLSVGDTLQTAFTREDLAMVSDAVTAACDGLDGLEDGVVFDTMGCQSAFDPGSLTCADGQNSACLPADKVAALERIHAGPTDSAGTQLYNEWLWDTGIDTGNWRFWKLESPIPPWGNNPLIAVMGSGSLAQIFTTPPTKVEGNPGALIDFLIGFDFDADAPKIFATSDDFPESPMDVMTPPSAADPTLADLQNAGGKLIVFHGVSDPVFSFKDTADWYARLNGNNAAADAFTRLYAIPGMPHGQGGNAADQVDLLGALVAWVEDGAAPGPVPATFRDGNDEVAAGNAGAVRPLCPWPAHAVFKGGDAMAASSFACE